MSDKVPVSFRLSLTAKELLSRLSREIGISRTAVLEIIIREKAKSEGIEIVRDDNKQSL